MHSTTRARRLAATGLGLAALTLVGLPTPAGAAVVVGDPACVAAEEGHGHGGGAARGGWGPDTRPVSAAEQRAISRRTARRLSGTRGTGPGDGATIRVHVHVMAAKNGAGNVPRAVLQDQVDVLNQTYAGAESVDAAETGFSFTLASVDRFFVTKWHRDKASKKYRTQTRKGGARALNVWLVDFSYLGVATFPWNYDRSPAIDGVRLNVGSLPGGDIPDYDLGETATHEVGHWLGLFHTFQGGCSETNDEVDDTPAQGQSSRGCPEGNDTCDLPGDDPIHNYMDYSVDTCYTQFTPGQSTRMNEMWTAYRA